MIRAAAMFLFGLLALAPPLALAQGKAADDEVVSWAKDRNAPDESITVHVLRTSTDPASGVVRQTYVRENWRISALPPLPFRVVWVMVDAGGRGRSYVLLQFTATDPRGEAVQASVERGLVRLKGGEALQDGTARPAQRPRAVRMLGLEN
jgi:hypothetical protein